MNTKSHQLNNSKTNLDWTELEKHSKKINLDQKNEIEEIEINNKINSISDAIKVANYCCRANSWINITNDQTDIDPVSNHLPFGIWYRGEKDSIKDSEKEPLTPSMFRFSKEKYYQNNHFFKYFKEMSFFHHFQLRSPSYRHEHLSIFEWLCLMQHYGGPTRLLDWTESLLFAIYFAIYKNLEENIDALVFVLNAWLLNYYSDTEYLDESLDFNHRKKQIQTPFAFNVILRANMAISNNLLHLFSCNELKQPNSNSMIEAPPQELWEELSKLYETNYEKKLPKASLDQKVQEFLRQMNKPVAVFPYRNNPRLHIQQGVFTIHGGKFDQKKESQYSIGKPFQFSDFNIDEKKEFLKVYRIPSESKKRLINELDMLGINCGLLFPELESQSENLRDIWSLYTNH